MKLQKTKGGLSNYGCRRNVTWQPARLVATQKQKRRSVVDGWAADHGVLDAASVPVGKGIVLFVERRGVREVAMAAHAYVAGTR